MKKRIKDLIIYIVIILLGVGVCLLLSARVEQLNKKEVQNEKVNKAILDIMY